MLPVLHNLEQVSSDEHVGSLAENLLEALKENEKVSAKVRISPTFVSCDSFYVVVCNRFGLPTSRGSEAAYEILYRVS